MIWKPAYSFIGLGLILAALASLAGVDSCRKKQGSNAQTQANVAKGEANAHQTQAQTSDAVAANLQAQLMAKETALGRLTAERGALLKRLESERQARLDAESAHPAAVEPIPDVRDALIAKDAEVIEAQGKEIAGLKDLTSQLVISRDQWKATAEARERQALAQQAATDAWKKAVTTSRWRGRIEGFAVGMASGYVAGRLK